jgi:hypothetical protein
VDLPRAGLDIWMSIPVESRKCETKLATGSNWHEAVDYQTLTISTLEIQNWRNERTQFLVLLLHA